MIISEKWKYIFVGLPFSASSAISKELVKRYDGFPVASKHANITELISTGVDISKYYIFAVYKDPIDIEFTCYNKLITNAYGIYTNQNYFYENGGWLSKRERRIYHKVKKKKLDFNDYLCLKHIVPYDNPFSLNRPYLNKILDFNRLNISFQEALRDIGINIKRDIPVFNETDKPDHIRVDNAIATKIFAPYYYYNYIPGAEKPNFYDAMIYRINQPVRFRKWKRFDQAMRKRAIDGYDYLDE